jgi:WD40 repeat protein
VNTGNQIPSFERHRAAVGATAFSPKGNAWLSGSGDRTVMFWDFSRITHYRELMPRVSESIKRLQTNPDDPAALSTLDSPNTVSRADLFEMSQGMSFK